MTRANVPREWFQAVIDERRADTQSLVKLSSGTPATPRHRRIKRAMQLSHRKDDHTVTL
jgi:hypothetical protein